MIPFEEIDKRLAALGKDRAWLAENTPYSSDYIRTVLAPKSTRRTSRVLQILSEAIEREELKNEDIKTQCDFPPDRITVEVSSERLDRYLEAADLADQQLKPWIISELNKAAEEWLAKKNQSGLRVAEDPTPYRITKKKP